MDVTPRELREIDFRTEWKGYHRDDVDDLLERAATTIEAANERVRELNGRVDGLQREEGAPPTRETEDMLRRTLVLAQRTADEAIAEAQAEARRVTEEAETSARRVTTEAQANARRIAEGERQRLEAEVLDLGSRREALLADVEQLERYAKDYRARLRAAIESDLDTLASRSAVTDTPRPTLHEVDLPGVGSKSDVSEPAVGGAQSPTPGERPGPSVAPGPNAGFTTSPVSPDPAARAPSPSSVPSPPPEPTSPAGPTGSTPHALQPAAAERPGSVPKPSPKPSPPPSLAAVDPPQAPSQPDEPLEAEVLDDDAFFASLREAVRDDTPLGPRSDEAETLVDPTDDVGRFGNVFKRRR